MQHSNLHQAQSHDILRSWQSERNDVNHQKDFVLPMFIGNDDDSIETIESMPGVCRYGCNRAIDYLEPLVNEHGLAAVLLFPVMTKQNDDQLRANVQPLSSDDELSSTSSQSRSSSSAATVGSSRSSSLSSTDETRRIGELQERAPGATVNQTSNNTNNTSNTNNSNTNNNPFLSQSEETENLLGSDQPEDNQPEDKTAHPARDKRQSVGRWIPVASQGVLPPTQGQSPQPSESLMMVSKAQDIKLIKGMALQDEHNPVLRLIPKLRAKYPGLLIICDVCLCAFTSTGHCCLFEDHSRAKGALASSGSLTRFPISNKLTCQYLAVLSVEYAKRGCDVVAPSDMMDGRILTIREKLNEHGLNHVSVLSYSAKFASAFYGPFRQATDNAPEFGDRRAYQLPPGSRALALKAVKRDIDQGADFVMVKPAGAYLDIVRDIKNEHPDIPIAVYQVSGEYSMLTMAAKAGLVDLKQAVNETLTSFRRAGATIIITYFTPDILRGQMGSF